MQSGDSPDQSPLVWQIRSSMELIVYPRSHENDVTEPRVVVVKIAWPFRGSGRDRQSIATHTEGEGSYIHVRVFE